MRCSALTLSAFVLSAAVSVAQTGFSTKTYTAILPLGSDNTKLLSADLNGDGHADLVSYGSRFTGTAPVNIFLNDGSGGFRAPYALPGSGGMVAVQVGDMNGDSYPDIVGCSNMGTGQSQAVSIVVYLNTGAGGFKAQPAVTGNGECNALALGDVLRNGHLDVVTAGYTPGQYDPSGKFFPGNTNFINVFANDGTGSITYRGTFSASLDDAATSSAFTNCGAIDAVGADFLQDGKFSLIVTSACQPSGQNNGGNQGTTFLVTETTDQFGNTFYTTAKHLNSAYVNYINGKVYDVNGDGKPDVIFNAVTGLGYGDAFAYAKNTGNGNFTFTDISNNLVGSTYTGGASVGDFNGDGINDLAASYNSTNSPPNPGVSIFAGTKTGSFVDSQDFASGTASESSGDITAADFNDDGNPDLATLVYDQNARTTSLKVYTNTQSASSNACSAPSTVNTNIICSPAQGATVASPVTVNAASNVNGFTANRLYLDNKDAYDSYSQTISTPLNIATGNHTLVLVSYNNLGQAFTSRTSFTVGSASGNSCVPSSAGVSICSPVSGSTDNPPITVIAGARAKSGYITAIRVYVDNVAKFTANNPSASTTFSVNQGGLDFGPGSHHLVVVGYQNTGGAVTNSLYFTQNGSASCNPSQPGATICSPAPNSTSSSPVTVSAGVTTASGYVASIRVYVDNSSAALIYNPQHTNTFSINPSLSIAPGTHNLVVVGYPSIGGSISIQENITIQ